MKKIMISQGIRNNPYPMTYIDKCKKVVEAFYEGKGEFVIINTFFPDFDGNRIKFLGKAIMEGLAEADEVVFMDDWETFDGCRCEHFIAAQYGIHCEYLSTI
jgi:hypothetical protein